MKTESAPATFDPASSDRQSSEASRWTFAFVFAPAVAALNRLSYARKFLIVGLLLLAPFGYVTHLLMKASDKQILFNEKERLGVAVIMPGIQFLRHLEMSHLHTVASLLGSTSARAELTQDMERADALLPLLDSLDTRHRDAFRQSDGSSVPSEAWARVKVGWSAIRAAHFDDPNDVSAAYRATAADVTAWILSIGNFSNLILDPDLDSYWLMDAFVAKLPTVAENLTRAWALALNDPQSPTWQEGGGGQRRQHLPAADEAMCDRDAARRPRRCGGTAHTIDGRPR